MLANTLRQGGRASHISTYLTEDLAMMTRLNHAAEISGKKFKRLGRDIPLRPWITHRCCIMRLKIAF